MTDSVRTPKHILTPLRREFRVRKFFDPAPYNTKFKKGGKTDGLLREWGKISFVNPPYSNVKPWFEKAHEEWRKGKTILMLVKLDTIATISAKKFMKGAELRVYSSKIPFVGYGGKLPFFNSVLIIWRAGKRSSKYSIINTPEVRQKTSV